MPSVKRTRKRSRDRRPRSRSRERRRSRSRDRDHRRGRTNHRSRRSASRSRSRSHERVKPASLPTVPTTATVYSTDSKDVSDMVTTTAAPPLFTGNSAQTIQTQILAAQVRAQQLVQQSLSGSIQGLKELAEPVSEMEKDAVQQKLDIEMQKRRERVEKWRKERRLQHDLATAKQQLSSGVGMAGSSKNWNLEDDDEDDDESSKDAADDADAEDDVDPLDAYMEDINKEVKQQRKGGSSFNPGSTETGSKFTVITAVARKPQEANTKKGELMETNIDGMEYSSEEEEETIADVMASNQRKDKYVPVDHTKIYYAPFRKNFYVEVPEIGRMTTEEVAEYRELLEGIKVRGKDSPKPIKTWVQCGISNRVLHTLKKNNFEKPTPIQCQAIPLIMSGRDMIGIAKTGSGKTLAFLIPLMRHIEDQAPLDAEDGPIAVILTPTRELALQIFKECRRLGKSIGLTTVCVYGGTGISEQIAELKRGAEIIVCTPGRMIDMLAANSGRVTNLRRTTMVILDEADRMFDMGFEPQVMRILDSVRLDRQTVMFSATFPRQMEVLARKTLTSPVEIQVGGRSVVCSDVIQDVEILDEEDKFFKLLELLGLFQESGSVLVFVDKQENADELMRLLLRHSYPCMALHGGIDQYDRDSIITDFKRGNVPLLVATSVAARGLDVKELTLVVNYDCPNHYEDYVHRCGRTGRAGKKGQAFTFITPDQERQCGDIVRAFQLSGQDAPPSLLKMFNDYKTRMESEGKKVKSSSGFHGKGFQFDEAESQLASERRRFQKAALGLHDSDDEDAGMDLDQKIDDMFASKKKVTSVSKQQALERMLASGVPLVPGGAPVVDGATGAGVEGSPAIGASVVNAKLLELARQKASKITIQRQLQPEQQPDQTQATAAAIFKGAGMKQPTWSNKTLAEQLAGKLNAKLGYLKQEEMEEEQTKEAADTVQRYEEELEINEFPQNVRWRITSKETLGQICEYYEVGMTVRGNYIPPGRGGHKDKDKDKDKESEERPLYLTIESTNEMSIQSAKKEVKRIVKEELVKLQTSNQPFNRGRYKVL